MTALQSQAEAMWRLARLALAGSYDCRRQLGFMVDGDDPRIAERAGSLARIAEKRSRERLAMVGLREVTMREIERTAGPYIDDARAG